MSLKPSFIVLFMLWGWSLTLTSSVQAVELFVEVNRISTLGEVIYLRLDAVSDEDIEFNNVPDEPLIKAKLIPNDKTEMFDVGDIGPGQYMIRLFQDVNGNGIMDTDKKGRPTEPYGLSNNRIFLKTPVLKDVVFEVKESNETIKINLRNKRGRGSEAEE